LPEDAQINWGAIHHITLTTMPIPELFNDHDGTRTLSMPDPQSIYVQEIDAFIKTVKKKMKRRQSKKP